MNLKPAKIRLFVPAQLIQQIDAYAGLNAARGGPIWPIEGPGPTEAFDDTAFRCPQAQL